MVIEEHGYWGTWVMGSLDTGVTWVLGSMGCGEHGYRAARVLGGINTKAYGYWGA